MYSNQFHTAPNLIRGHEMQSHEPKQARCPEFEQVMLINTDSPEYCKLLHTYATQSGDLARVLHKILLDRRDADEKYKRFIKMIQE